MTSCLQQPRIVVIGAGMAGLSAAAHLVEKGFSDVTVLEASHRIGGRIHTVQFGESEYPIELGANWIHGATLDNSTFELANKLNVLQPYRLQNRYSCRFLREDGTEIDRDIAMKAWNLFQTIDEKIRTQVPKDHKVRQVNVKSVLENIIQEELVSFRQKDSHNESRVPDLLKAFNPMINHLSFHEGDGLNRISWDAEYFDLPGGNIHIPKGYDQLLQHLVTRLSANSIRLNTEVNNIKVCDDSQGLSITTINGSISIADHVIVTCSLGYLKKNNRKLFCPPLPKEKQNAIARLGFGRVDKIFLEFEHAVTKLKHKDIAFAWDHLDIGHDKREWYRNIFGFENVFTRDTTLLGWIHGDAAEHMETLTNQEIGDICVKLLRQFLQDPSIPYPKAVNVSRWCSDPYSHGSYSYICPDSKSGDQSVLADPILSDSGIPRVMFAGEATVQDQYGCTHAARSSGIREAERLCSLYIRKLTKSSKL